MPALGALRCAHVGRTFYPEQAGLEAVGLVAEDDARHVHVRLRRLHVGVTCLRHQRHWVRTGRSVVRDRRMSKIMKGPHPALDPGDRLGGSQYLLERLGSVHGSALWMAEDALVVAWNLERRRCCQRASAGRSYSARGWTLRERPAGA